MREYKIIESRISTTGLENKVFKEIKQGWVPFGAPYTYTDNLLKIAIHCQAMTR